MLIDINGTNLNVKKIGEFMVEKLILDLIKINHPDKKNVIDWYMKKHKGKPHKKLYNEMSLIECCVKYNNIDLLKEYVQDLNINAPNYNIINLCVSCNRVDMLRKYIKEKNININQLINGETPLTIAIKLKYVECFSILIEHNCNMALEDADGNTPLGILLDLIVIENLKEKEYDENRYLEYLENSEIVFSRMLNGLLPVDFELDNPEITENIKKMFDSKLMHESDFFDKIVQGIVCDDNCDNIVYYHSLVVKNIHFGKNDICRFIRLIKNGFDVYVNNIVNRRPYILLMLYADRQIIEFLCEFGNSDMIDNIIENHDEVLNMNENIMNILVCGGKMKQVKQIIEKYPLKACTIDDKEKTLIDAVVKSKNLTDKQKIKYIDYFVKKNVDVNHISCGNTCSLDIAIQFSTMDVLKKLVKHSHIKDPMINPIVTACRLEKLDMLQLLVKKGYRIEKSVFANVLLPNCIGIILTLNNFDMIKYVMNEPRFMIGKKQKDIIYQIAKNIKCTDNILKIINKQHDSNDNDRDPDIARLNGVISLAVPFYDEDKETVLKCVKMIVILLLKVINYDEIKDKKHNIFEEECKFAKQHYNFTMLDNRIVGYISAIINYTKIKSITIASIFTLYSSIINMIYCEDFIKTYKDSLKNYEQDLTNLSTKIDILYNEIENDDDNDWYIDDLEEEDKYIKLLKICETAFLRFVEECSDDDIDYSDDDSDKNFTKQILSIIGKKAKKLKSIISETKQNDNTVVVKSEDNNCTKITPVVKQSNKTIILDEKLINTMLSKLNYPIKTKNYDVLKKMLLQQIEYCENDNTFDIIENGIIIASIFKNNRSEIPNFISHYGLNICTDEKMDDNHMFPFGIDILLLDMWINKSNTIKCSYRTINQSRKATCLYFSGKILRDGKMCFGYFEYFVNDKNILFHRMFKPVNHD